MKLLIISEYFPSTTTLNFTGGVETRNYYIASELSKHHSVTVIASYEKGKPRWQKLQQVAVHRVGKIRDYNRMDKLSRLIFSWRAFWTGLYLDFDVIEGSGFWGWLPAWLLGLIKNKPKTILIADVLADYGQQIDVISYWLLRIWENF